MKPSSILIIDDHPMMRAALKATLHNQPDLKICEEAGTLEEGKRLMEALQPNLLLLDLYLPDGNGKELIAYRNANCPQTKVLVVTSASDEKEILAVLKAGAQGIIGKNAPAERVQFAVREVLGGRSYLMEEAAYALLHAYQQQEQLEEERQSLSSREQQVMALLARGATNKDIAAELVISESTVRTHLMRISNKLKLENKRELVLYAVKHGNQELQGEENYYSVDL